MNSSNLTFVAGLGSTGSSAVCDLLSECDTVLAPKEEWRIWVDPQCLIDLCFEIENNNTLFTNSNLVAQFNNNLKKISGRSFGKYSLLSHNQEISKCLDQIRSEILAEILSFQYTGLWYGNSNILNSKLNFLFRRVFWKKRLINYDMFLLKHYSKRSIYQVIGAIIEKNLNDLLYNTTKSHLVINENFSILRADEIFRLHPTSKIILTTRSPLDVYADSYRVGWLAMPYEIEKFILWQNKMIEQVSTIYERNRDKIMIIPFEDLVLDYETRKAEILDFTGLQSVHLDQFSKFDPAISKKNIGQWEKICPWLREYADRFEKIKI